MSSNPELIKRLREETGARMKDCVEALKATQDNYEEAQVYLRKKNLAKGDKTSERAAGEGMIGHKLSANGAALTLVELTANTDFVVKNLEFRKLLDDLLGLADARGVHSAEELLRQELAGRAVADVVKELAGKIGENIAVKGVTRIEGSFGYYVHHSYKQAAAVVLEGVPAEKAAEIGKDLSMHCVFSKPRVLAREEIPAADVAKEKEIITEGLKADPKNAKKPPEILEKIATGQLGKFYGSVCLLDQPYYRENKKTVAEVLRETAGSEARIKAFKLLVIGAG